MNDKKYRADCVDWLEYSSISDDREREAARLDRPLIVQFAGDDPSTVVKAAQFVHEQVPAFYDRTRHVMLHRLWLPRRLAISLFSSFPDVVCLIICLM